MFRRHPLDRFPRSPRRSGLRHSNEPWFLIGAHARNERLLRFAALGIFPDESAASDGVLAAEHARISWAETHGPDDLDDDQLRALLIEVVRDAIAASGDSPLTQGFTGGFDSRPLYFALRELGESPILFSIGQPGNIDHDVVELVRDRSGIPIEIFDTNRWDWNLGELDDFARVSANLQLSPLAITRSVFDSRFPYRREVNGFLNDVLSGDNREKGSGAKAEDPVKSFLLRNDLFGFQSLMNRELVRSVAPTSAVSADFEVDVYRQLDLAYRQLSRLKPSFSPLVTFVTPYEDPRWMGYWLNRTPVEHAGQNRWMRFVRSLPVAIFPDLAGLDLDGKMLRRARRDRMYGAKGFRALAKMPAGVDLPTNPLHHFDAYSCARNNASLQRTIDDSLRRLHGRQVVQSSLIDKVREGFAGPRDQRSIDMLSGLVAIDLAFESGWL